jgi:Ion channel
MQPIAFAGIFIILLMLLEAFETVVLPRRVTRWFRLTRLYYICTWVPWKWVARRIKGMRQRETFLSFYGPLSLLILFAIWGAGLLIGFALLYYGNEKHDPSRPSLALCFYLSGTTLFTLGIGDVTPHTAVERVLIVFESGLGLGFLALVVSYLPVIYSAFSRREVSIVLLDARAGSPPTAAELLRRHNGPHGMEALRQLFADWERWSAELLESHISYPVVSYFRSQHSNESWLAALTTILDATALLMAMGESACARQAKLTFAMCRHTLVDLSQVFHARPVSPKEDRLPEPEFLRLREALEQAGYQLQYDEHTVKKLKDLRLLYEPYLEALSQFLFVVVPPWILAKEIADNWKTTAWGRISGLASKQVDVGLDDHAD